MIVLLCVARVRGLACACAGCATRQRPSRRAVCPCRTFRAERTSRLNQKHVCASGRRVCVCVQRRSGICVSLGGLSRVVGSHGTGVRASAVWYVSVPHRIIIDEGCLCEVLHQCCILPYNSSLVPSPPKMFPTIVSRSASWFYQVVCTYPLSLWWPVSSSTPRVSAPLHDPECLANVVAHCGPQDVASHEFRRCCARGPRTADLACAIVVCGGGLARRHRPWSSARPHGMREEHEPRVPGSNPEPSADAPMSWRPAAPRPRGSSRSAPARKNSGCVS